MVVTLRLVVEPLDMDSSADRLRLTQLMRDLCGQMAILSDVAASPLENTAPPADRDFAPRGSSRTMGDEWWGYFAAAPGWDERLVVYHRARAAFAKQKGKRPVLGTGTERDKNIIAFYVGEPAEFVAVCEGISISSVWRVRKQHDRKQSDGTKEIVKDP